MLTFFTQLSNVITSLTVFHSHKQNIQTENLKHNDNENNQDSKKGEKEPNYNEQIKYALNISSTFFMLAPTKLLASSLNCGSLEEKKKKTHTI